MIKLTVANLEEHTGIASSDNGVYICGSGRDWIQKQKRTLKTIFNRMKTSNSFRARSWIFDLGDMLGFRVPKRLQRKSQMDNPGDWDWGGWGVSRGDIYAYKTKYIQKIFTWHHVKKLLKAKGYTV